MSYTNGVNRMEEQDETQFDEATQQEVDEAIADSETESDDLIIGS